MGTTEPHATPEVGLTISHDYGASVESANNKYIPNGRAVAAGTSEKKIPEMDVDVLA